MYNYKSLSKSQLIELLNIVENRLVTAEADAAESNASYSLNPTNNNYPYQFGFVTGRIKDVIQTINSYKSL